MRAPLPDVRAALESAILSEDGTHLTLSRTVPRALYLQIDRALKTLGGRWNSRLGAHVFDGDVGGQLEELRAGSALADPNPLDFFPTPNELARTLAQRLWERCSAMQETVLRNGKRENVVLRALEPSAGEGHLARALKNCGFEVTCVEQHPGRASTLRSQGFTTLQADFLTLDLPRYDAVGMNPPFSAPRVRYAYAQHVEKAYTLLNPGGVLMAIVPAGALEPSARASRFIWEHGSGEKLPSQSFRASGTAVETALITLIRSHEEHSSQATSNLEALNLKTSPDTFRSTSRSTSRSAHPATAFYDLL